jgi:hypothetical protein
LTRIRQRLGVDVFARFFERVVDLCQAAGLVWGRELFFDATKIEANAALDSLVPRFYHQAKIHVAGLFADDPTPEEGRGEGGAAPPSPGDRPVPPDGLLRLPASEGQPEATDTPGAEPRWKLLEERRLDPDRPPVEGYRRTTDYRVSSTDPDAAPMQTRNGTALGYHDHYVVDGGKARIVLAALVTPADVVENAPMRDLLWRTCFRRKLRPHHVTADTTYGTVENVVAVENAGIRAYVPLPDWGSRRPQFFAQADFTFDAERDAYRCPEGQTLRRDTAKFADEVVVYRAAAATCNACPVKAACTASDRGRTVRRSFHAEYLERVRGYHATAAYRKAMRKRQVWVEPLFAEAKQWHGLRRFRLRGLENVNSEGLLVAAGQNLKRLLAATGWGRRHAPCGSLLALPKGARRLAAASG